ncbi:centrosome-associated protein CEP250-like [Pleuronectes platessa]|uniref:centrosome-associated protein CEP250-like n=1 Tax=Pleuronectes platessa TaxID=8262 RepID=UPI00232A3B43|nr:centrosome-associated protein CEP250-like [Pleuronectes platessa]
MVEEEFGSFNELEHTREEPQKATEEENSLRNRCVFLEEKQIQKKEQIELLEVQVSELQVELGDGKIRVGALEKRLSQKELQLLDFHKQHGVLQAERDGLKGELHHLKSQQYKAVKEAQEQANRLVVDQQAEEEKAGALKEHTRVLTRCIEAMQSSIQRMQELESERCAQQRKQESLLAVICRSLKEEHQAELQRLKKQIAQENQRTALQLDKAVQLAKKEADRLRVTLEERDRGYNRITAELDQQHRHWAQELGAECQHVQLLVEQSGAKQRAVQLPACPTVAEALTTLRALREQLEHLIIHLHQELGSQKQTTEQLRKDKERELCAQRQQLRVERDRALDSVKERLIQEHIEELSSLNRTQLTDGGAEEGGAAGSLRKQLKAKDVELRQVQRSMAQWKQQTAARLACKFEEELTAELER